jgi:hypothetical protein
MSVLTRYKNLIILAIFLLVWGTIACAPNTLAKPVAPQAVAGALDLRQWDFEQNGATSLSGEWEFYWGQLLSPESFSTTTPPAITGLMAVPGSWEDNEVNGQLFRGDGYATYRLTVHFNPASLPEKFLP